MENQFHPMETAPKDGTRILVWNENLEDSSRSRWMLVAWLLSENYYKEQSEETYGWSVPESYDPDFGDYVKATNPIAWTHLPKFTVSDDIFIKKVIGIFPSTRQLGRECFYSLLKSLEDNSIDHKIFGNSLRVITKNGLDVRVFVDYEHSRGFRLNEFLVDWNLPYSVISVLVAEATRTGASFAYFEEVPTFIMKG